MSSDTNKKQYFRSECELKWTHVCGSVTLQSYEQRVSSNKQRFPLFLFQKVDKAKDENLVKYTSHIL